MSRPSVLIVEDEREIADLMQFHLQRAGFETAVEHRGKAAIEAIRKSPPDVVLLDLMLPDLDGLEICRRIRASDEHRRIGVVMVTAKGDESDVVSGIELGADDYISKPFSPRVLVARVKAVLRRSSDGKSSPSATKRTELANGRLVVDPERHVTHVDGKPVDLTLTEFGMLHFLVQRPGFVRTRDQIIAAVHGRNVVLSSRTVDVHMTALRRKLGDLGTFIETVRGVGYRFAEGETAPVE
ncbi:MAG: Alkaline phosphatase synthesis transcriptional regulatory protein PhoP [Planctomycetota bacterium]|jgi:two-component system alkaline phosphatase synthesis response regulator PhoP